MPTARRGAGQNLAPNNSFRTLKSAVLGLGVIGRALVLRLAENCSPPAMYDPNPDNQVVALKMCGHLAPTAIDAVREADVIFGASGYTSITADLIPFLKHGVMLISVSSEDTEFDRSALARMGTHAPIYREGHRKKEANRIGTALRDSRHRQGRQPDR